jgi:hypothetical protein
MSFTARWVEFMSAAMLASCVLIAAVTTSNAMSSNENRFSINITNPIDGGSVSSKYTVEGNASEFPLPVPKNTSLWLLSHSHSPKNESWEEGSFAVGRDRTWYVTNAAFGTPDDTNQKYDIQVALPDEKTNTRWSKLGSDETKVISADHYAILTQITVTRTFDLFGLIYGTLTQPLGLIASLITIVGVLLGLRKLRKKQPT